MSILDKITAATRLRVERDKAACPQERLGDGGGFGNTPFAFEKALAAPGVSFICEIKRASPSKGLIAPDFSCRRIAREYEAAGAAAISVLTEPDFFLGSDAYLTAVRETVAAPLLRKDFIIDDYQIRQAKAIGADAVLLICAILRPEQLRAYRELADSLGLSALVEVHNEAEAAMAVEAGARVVGVNNRDLRTFQVDMGNSVRLRELIPREVLFVSESGITGHTEVSLLARHGVDAVLVGESLMRSPDKGAALAALRGGNENDQA